MLTYTRINDRFKLQYDGIDIKCRWKSENLNNFKSDFHMISIKQDVINMVNWHAYAAKTNNYTVENPPNILSDSDLRTIEDILKMYLTNK